MNVARVRPVSAATLLSAALVWLVLVTLCSTRTLDARPAHAHESAGTHSGPDHDSGAQHENACDDGCGCESFKVFPAQSVATAKAPSPSASLLLYSILLDEFTHESVASAITARNTGPPPRVSFAELVWQRCRLSHAPPLMV